MRIKPTPEEIIAQGFSRTIFQRFWKHVEKTDTCWIWRGSVNHKGYGKLTRCVSGFPHVISTHRFSWLIHFGEVPEGMCVCHSCDIPACVNPGHLWIGTNKANSEDMARKGRASREVGHPGEEHVFAKFTWDQVRKIRAEYVPWKISLRMLAAKHGVHSSTIDSILRKRTWKE